MTGPRYAYAIGNFDGVHLGHAALLHTHVTAALHAGLTPAVATFSPHPRAYFHPNSPPFALTTAPEKAALIRALGVDHIVPLPFDAALAAATPHDFAHHVLCDHLHAASVTVGAEFCFGRNRSGTTATLQTLGAELGFAVHVIDPVGDGEKYSSSRIRDALHAGDVAEATRQLGRAWAITGTVQHGDARGRTIGFPTANLDMGTLIRPRLGVYAARAILADGTCYPAALNIGRRPTIGGTDVRAEAHLIGFDGDLYGQTLRLALHAFVRPEMTFDGLDALKAQIARDVETTLQLLPETIQ